MIQNERSTSSSAGSSFGTRCFNLNISKPGVLRYGREAFGALFVITALFALVAASVQAKQVRLLTGRFGASTSIPANPYPLVSPEHVAVDDSSHDVYVTDRVGARIEKFNEKGEFLLMFGKAVNKTKVKEAGSTEAEQNICTAVSGDECGTGERVHEKGEPPLVEPTFIAVDNSSSESKGDVYVANRGANQSGGLIDKFDSVGKLLSSWATGGQLDGSAVKTPPAPVEGPFAEIVGVATDTSGNLWVQDSNETTFEFRPNASFVTGWRFGGEEFSIDSEGNLYALAGSYALEHNSSGQLLGDVADSSGNEYLKDIVMDPSTNNLYIGVGRFIPPAPEEYFIARYDSSCHPTIEIESGGLGTPCVPVETFALGLVGYAGLGIDPSTSADSLYVVESEEPIRRVALYAVETVPDVAALIPSGLTSTAATLEGNVNPSGVPLTECYFEWGETTAYGNKAPCETPDAAEIPADSSGHAVHASIAGLQAGKTYHYRLVAANANDVNALVDEPSRSPDFVFGPPSIESESAVDVASTSATLQAQIDPNDIDTKLHVEYGVEAGVYGQSTPEADVGSGGVSESVPFHLQGLQPGTVYHYRVVATNSLGMSEGQDQTFTTQVVGVFSLLDDRTWELVSPPDKHGALIEPLMNFGVTQASADGDAISYLATAPTESQPAGSSGLVQVFSARAKDGWGSLDIASSREVANGVNVGGPEEYRFFSSDLSSAVVQPLATLLPPLSSEATERTPFLRSDFAGGGREEPCVSSCYRPLVTGAPGIADVPEGTEFASGCAFAKKTECRPEFVGASADGRHIILSSEVSLVEGAPAGTLYEWAAGQLQPVSALPESEGGALASASLGGQGVRGNAVSADGSRVVWWVQSGAGKLYLSDTILGETVLLGAGAEFQTASSDGARVFFTKGGDLYMFEAPPGGALSAGHATDLAPGAEVVGILPGAAADGSSIYFAANGVLTNTPNARGETAIAGDCGSSAQPVDTLCNLYVWRGGVVRLVAVLSGRDAPDWGSGGGARVPPTTARVSPNGGWLAFMSERSLTGYDNRDVASGEHDEEVFLYDATVNNGEGGLVCASCNPTGARPHGLPDRETELDVPPLVDQQGVWTRHRLAGNIPAWTSALYQSRYLSDSGRLFFNSFDALVPSDTNGTEDVYEYEPPGVGDCTTGGFTFNTSADGCVDLVSSGTAKEESAFLDASENGDSVFFLTSAQLTPADTDSTLDVYDARVDGGFAEPQAPPACEGDACQSPVAPPTDPTPGSLTYQGPGNPTPLLTPSKAPQQKTLKCPKGKKLAHGKCVKSKSKNKRKKTSKARRTVKAGSKRRSK